MDKMEKAMEIITEIFSDTSVTKIETKEKLNELIGEIKIMLDTLDN